MSQFKTFDEELRAELTMIHEGGTEDSIHRHMRSTDLRHWTDIASEGSRLMSIVVGGEVELTSPIDNIMGGVAAQAADGVWEAMARYLGVPMDDLKSDAAQWYENPEKKDRAYGILSAAADYRIFHMGE